MLKVTDRKIINFVDVHDLNDLVERTYKRPYNFQQQDGCKDRGKVFVTVPNKDFYDYERETVTEVVNADCYDDYGVSFKAWLERNPTKLLPIDEDEFDESWSEESIQNVSTFRIKLWWERNFYPHIDMVLNDLYEKGLIEVGEYCIEIDW